MAHLEAHAFEELARGFAARSSSQPQSWAYLQPPESGPFGRATGYLRSSPLLLLDSSLTLAMESASQSDDVDDGVLTDGIQLTSRVELHIVHSTTYRAPVLLLQGYAADGQLWTADQVHAHLIRSSPTSSIAASSVTQAEHPVLLVPFFSVHACRTADWMDALLHRVDGETSLPNNSTYIQLDFLSGWWSVLAPLVGASFSPSDARNALRQPLS